MVDAAPSNARAHRPALTRAGASSTASRSAAHTLAWRRRLASHRRQGPFARPKAAALPPVSPCLRPADRRPADRRGREPRGKQPCQNPPNPHHRVRVRPWDCGGGSTVFPRGAVRAPRAGREGGLARRIDRSRERPPRLAGREQPPRRPRAGERSRRHQNRRSGRAAETDATPGRRAPTPTRHPRPARRSSRRTPAAEAERARPPHLHPRAPAGSRARPRRSAAQTCPCRRARTGTVGSAR
mmetsp:Transcript_3789/g.11721  ORF Transcript_3789/g.11721 Transcript_3789/m.11721 type:complete len:241 (-) Transcript_3789:498-1220(-)